MEEQPERERQTSRGDSLLAQPAGHSSGDTLMPCIHRGSSDHRPLSFLHCLSCFQMPTSCPAWKSPFSPSSAAGPLPPLTPVAPQARWCSWSRSVPSWVAGLLPHSLLGPSSQVQSPALYLTCPGARGLQRKRWGDQGQPRGPKRG